MRTHMQDLKDVTRETHYENYRAQCIQSMTRLVVKERNRKYGQRPGQSRQGRGPKRRRGGDQAPPLFRRLSPSRCWGSPSLTNLLSPFPSAN